ncbi:MULTISPECIES: 1,4-alpha-glucan branching protein GlgB [Shewanella]|uniref:1,4-alpha-glucan branching enzyme GlgB n=1 Tax=Shewanella psychromarinicola TaxID=2487742 RepID=A0A3N4ECQ9_9GAMM|nr:1,4-alpha-glucan branching protein GlgB [Shewanella psychromarinicola]AZG36081.1 1,4-alpha-glucan branching protein GlgB [Shewanella psychromarinicola]MCL1080452.1 1,4-alpha-glucan branching protein GlgB [Shewanella psychromarinicola]RPA31771.1 1,4-alpha-glucan branching protein GlgB [Shewanella psychromarinicola]
MTVATPYFHSGSEIALLNGEYTDVFSLLGMHSINDGKALVVRCLLPGALSVDVLSAKDHRKVASLEHVNEQGLFAGKIARRVKPFQYLLRVKYPLCEQLIIDPYQFDSVLDPDDVYLFGEGSQLQTYHFQGANWRQHHGVTGVHFCVWAPNAKQVALIGDFNLWDKKRHVLRHHPGSGLWDIFIADVEPEQHYKYAICDMHGNEIIKSDPYAVAMQPSPHNASKIPKPEHYDWQDSDWLTDRASSQSHAQPMSIYEVQLASWRRTGDDGQDYTDYTQLIAELVPYVKEMGFTHLQLMPISEYPFDGSWGYQPVGLFAPTYRFGDANGLKAFIDECHQQGIAVLLDWVPAHFPRDPHGLVRFDGSCLYEHEDPRKGEHPDWDTLIYNYGRAEVRSFLYSNAYYWLDEFHFDGLRLDAVSSMLYLDYSRTADQWVPNEFGGRENLHAISFLQELNARMYQSFPGINMIAEESTAWPGVTQATSNNGLGFGFKWNMGWMNDTLRYISSDPLFRRYHHGELTFSLVYAFTEQFILSLSHDEVVHGKGSLLHKIPGDDWQKFATLRAYYGFMWSHPGKKLLFMGNEFAQRSEWNHDQSLDWHLLTYAPHQGVQDWVRDLNQCYQQYPALYQRDHNSDGFQWLDGNNADNNILVFCRFGINKQQPVVIVVNMSPQVYHDFRIGVPTDRDYVEIINSDHRHYGGSHVVNDEACETQATPWQGMPQSIVITVPPLGCCFWAPALDELDEPTA